MKSIFKKIFEDKCPTCNEPLLSIHESLSSTKYCEHGHYKEENYSSLGVRIIYDVLE